MNTGRFLLKKVTDFMIAAVILATCVCMGSAAEAGDSPKSWYDKDGKQYGKEYGYVIINGQTLYRESVTTYDAKGWRHINIFWIYPDNSRRDKHIWFDGKGVRHEEWKK